MGREGKGRMCGVYKGCGGESVLGLTHLRVNPDKATSYDQRGFGFSKYHLGFLISLFEIGRAHV